MQSESLGRVAALNVRRLREARGWTRTDLAAEVTALGHELSAFAVGAIEEPNYGGRSPRKIDVDTLAALAWVLDVSPARLLDPRPVSDGWELGGVTLDPFITDGWIYGNRPLPGMTTSAADRFNQEQPEWRREELQLASSPVGSAIRELTLALQEALLHGEEYDADALDTWALGLVRRSEAVQRHVLAVAKDLEDTAIERRATEPARASGTKGRRRGSS